LEVPKAIGLPVDELHLVVDSFGDAVVAGEAPHGNDFFRPGGERLAELDELGKAGLHVDDTLIESCVLTGDQVTRTADVFWPLARHVQKLLLYFKFFSKNAPTFARYALGTLL
jgi:hypothetical protein